MIGKKLWVFADGDLPPHPENLGEPRAHEALMVVNDNVEEAMIEVTLLFEDKEPKEGLELRVAAKRVHCFRLDQKVWNIDYYIPQGQYALILRSNVPVVAVFGRLDRRKDVAYYAVAPYAE